MADVGGMEHVKAEIRSPLRRLVTLTGAAGCGKTRSACSLAPSDCGTTWRGCGWWTWPRSATPSF